MQSKSYNLFLDDERTPSTVKWLDLPQVEWVIVRNYKDFVDTILRDGMPIRISFDHDLQDEHYKEYFRVKEIKFADPIDYSKFKEKSGYECAKWLANYCVDNNIPVPVYYVHTLNGPGGANIFSILESARRVMML